jgi:phosphopantothenoylcysteine decarboxylase/phosphopantothenate--cysteine ligase
MELVLRDRKVLLGVTGGIAAYKAAELCRLLVKSGAQVQVVLTRGAQEFVRPLTFAALSRRPVHTEIFDPERESASGHIALARWADVIVVAPATAHALAKLANGLCDDLLSTLLIATAAPIVLAPAMNPTMLLHPATQENLRRLGERPGVTVLESPPGEMAEPEEGPGRLLEPPDILRAVARALAPLDFEHRKVIVTAGPTREPLDPVRFLSNRSSGKMGFALAGRAAARGGDVVLVSGPSALLAPPRVRLVRVETTAEMRDAVLRELAGAAALIKAAAPADYRAERVAEQKLKKGDAGRELRLVPTDDILSLVRERKDAGTVVVGFAAETENLLEHAREKIRRKGLDLCVANEVGNGRAFDSDQNRVTLLGADGNAEELPELPKSAVADAILDRVATLLARQP